MADASDIITNTRSVINDVPVKSLADAKSWGLMLSDYGDCLEQNAPISNARFEEAKIDVSMFDCRDGVVIFYMQHDSGRISFRPIYSEIFDSKAKQRQGQSLLIKQSFGQGAKPQPSPPPREIKIIICQKKLSQTQFLIKIRTRDGACIDQVLDTERGIVIAENAGVSCKCD